MNKDDLARTAIAGLRPARSGWARTRCPFCVDRIGTPDKRGAFAFYFPFAYYKCFRCGVKGVIGGYRSDYKNEDFDHDSYHSAKAPPWFLPLWQEPALSATVLQPAIQYAESRGFDLGVRQEIKMGAAIRGKYSGCIVIPHRDERGQWWGFTARKWFKKVQDPYRYPDGMSRDRLFNESALTVDTTDPALMMEGVLDCALYYPDSIGGLGKPIEDHMSSLLRTKRPIAVILDGDAWRTAYLFALRLRFEGIRAGAVRLPPGRDPNNQPYVSTAAIRRAAAQCITTHEIVRVRETA